MDETFESRVRAAAVAAWWALLIAIAFFTVQWLAYLLVMSAKPEWATPFWGPGATWESIRTVWFGALVFLKLTLWLVVLGAVWLTLWAKQLRKRTRSA